jgi:hypothetical protein
MNQSSTSVRIAQAGVVAILIAAPFHAFITVWGASLVGNYTALRLWSAVIIAVLSAIGVYWLVRDTTFRGKFFGLLLVRLILVYALITLLYAVLGIVVFDIAPRAAFTGLLLNVRYLAFFLLVWATAQYSPWLGKNWHRLLLVPGFIVAAFAVVQYVALPSDFLRHFGYGPGTIDPFETINNNPAYLRFSSTLRGPNPLGAYMLVIFTTTLALWNKKAKRKFLLSLTAVLSLCALLISFSRSAWIGVVVSTTIVLAVRYHSRFTKQRVLLAGAIVLAIVVAVFFAANENRFVQNAIFHTDDSSVVKTSSNNARSSALSSGAVDVLTNPVGGGVGSAGPASFQSNGAVDIAENYFVQIGQETGWLGLGLFLSIIFVLAKSLWQNRMSALSLACFASLMGLIVVNMLSHAWADDTLAFVWWGMAGLALATAQKEHHAKAK